ncbi:MAG: restriction endonuclease subunit S [Anaerolineales bacterium]|nr:restriction endonuclease subunit S [Anaerolineales bacterium]
MIPETWNKATIGELCQMVKGKAPIMKTKPGEYPLVTMGEEHKTADKYELDTEAVCVPMISSFGHGKPGLKRVHYIKGKFALSNILTALIVKEPNKLSTRYLALYLQTFKDQLIVPLQTGAANMSLRPEKLAGVPVHFPSLKEQEHIVKILQEIDLLRQLRSQARQRSADLIPAIFYEMFGDPDENPKKWDVYQLSEIAFINPKPKKTDLPPLDTPVTFVPMAAVDADRYEIVAPEVKPLKDVLKGFTPFQNNDVIFAKITPCMENGKIVVAEKLINNLGYGSTEFHVLRPQENLVTSEWLLWFVRRIEFREKAKSAFTGTAGQQRVPSSFMQNYKVPLPPMKLQVAFSKRIADVGKLVSQQAQNEEQINRLYDTSLAKAFAGEL